MKPNRLSLRLLAPWVLCALPVALSATHARAETGSVYYVCPGNVFTNTISSKEAAARGCTTKEAQQPTTISGPKVHGGGGARTASAAGSGPAESKVDKAEQKARDSDARRILQDELSKEQAALDALKKEYNNGQPERQGNERNYQKYLDRVEQLKSSIARKQSDVEALQRELAKLPS
jgi:chromosome segregation ATPase